jgi:hypothetical protein
VLPTRFRRFHRLVLDRNRKGMRHLLHSNVMLSKSPVPGAIPARFMRDTLHFGPRGCSIALNEGMNEFESVISSTLLINASTRHSDGAN